MSLETIEAVVRTVCTAAVCRLHDSFVFLSVASPPPQIVKLC